MNAGGMYVVWIFSLQDHSPLVHCTFGRNACVWRYTLEYRENVKPGKKSMDLFLVRLLWAVNDFASLAFVLT